MKIRVAIHIIIHRSSYYFDRKKNVVAFVLICIPNSMFSAIYNRDAFKTMHNKMIYGAL